MLVQAVGLFGEGREQPGDIGAGAVPLVLAVVLLLLLIAAEAPHLRSQAGSGEGPVPVPQSPRSSDEGTAAMESGGVTGARRFALDPHHAFLLASGASLVVMWFLGVVPAVAVLTLTTMRWTQGASWTKAVLTCLGLTAALYVLFAVLLNVRIPLLPL